VVFTLFVGVLGDSVVVKIGRFYCLVPERWWLVLPLDVLLGSVL